MECCTTNVNLQDNNCCSEEEYMHTFYYHKSIVHLSFYGTYHFYKKKVTITGFENKYTF